MHQVVVPRNAEQKGNTGETGISEGSSPKDILASFHGWISCFYFFLLFYFYFWKVSGEGVSGEHGGLLDRKQTS